MESSFLLIKPDALHRPWLRYRKRGEEDPAVDADPASDASSDADPTAPSAPNDSVETFVETLCEDKAQAILSRVKAEGFTVQNQLHTVLSPQQAADIAAHLHPAAAPESHANAASLLDGPVLLLHLTKPNAISHLATLVGPPDPEAARSAAQSRHGGDLSKWPLTAAFGCTGYRNACLCAQTEAQAQRLLELFFPSPARWERTLGLLVADDMDEDSGDFGADLEAALAEEGLVKCFETEVELSEAMQAALALPEGQVGERLRAVVVEGLNAAERLPLLCSERGLHRRLRCSASSSAQLLQAARPPSAPAPPALLALLRQPSASQLQALHSHLSRRNLRTISAASIRPSAALAIKLFPTDAAAQRRFLDAESCYAVAVSSAAAEQSLSLAVSAMPADLRETAVCLGRHAVRAVFPRVRAAAPPVEDAEEYLGMRRALAPREGEEEDPAAPSLQGVLTDALAALCKEKPAGLAAVEFLARWLLENNPNKAAADKAKKDREAQEKEKKQEEKGGEEAEGDVPNRGAVIPLRPEVPPHVVCVIGAKATELCEAAANARGFCVMSMSTLLQKEVEVGSALGKEIAACLEEKKRIEIACLLGVLQKNIRRARKEKLQVIVEGFPKDVDQALALEKEVFPCHTLVHLYDEKREEDKPEAADADRLQPLLDLYAHRGKLRKISIGAPKALQMTQLLPLLEPEMILIRHDEQNTQSGPVKQVLQQMERRFGYVCVSMDQLLEEEAKLGTERGARVKEMLLRRQIVADEIQIELLQAFLRSSPASKFVLTDFPSSLSQLSKVEANVATLRCVLHLAQPIASKPAITSPMWKQLEAQGRIVKITAHSAGQACRDTAAWLLKKQSLLCCWDDEALAKICDMAPEHGVVVLKEKELLQAEMKAQSAEGTVVESMLRSNQMVPADLRIRILRKAMQGHPQDSFLIEGFPKAVDQAELFDTLLGSPYALLCHKNSSAPAQFQSQIEPMLHRYCAQGLLSPFSSPKDALALASPLPSIICITPTPSNPELLQQFAEERNAAIIDVNAAIAAAAANPSNYFNQAILAVQQDSDNRREALVEAQAALLRRSMIAAGPDEVILHGDLQEHAPLLLKLSQPDIIFHLAPSEASLKKKLLEEQPEAEESEINEIILQQMEAQNLQVAPLIERDLRVVKIREETIAALRKHLGVQIAILTGGDASLRSKVSSHMHIRHNFARIDFHALLKEEVSVRGQHAEEIERALRSKRMVPLEAAIDLLQSAIRRIHAPRILLDGYPCSTHDGFPFIHDQVFALEQRFGKLLGLIRLDAQKPEVTGEEEEARVRAEREWKAEQSRADACEAYFSVLGKALKVDAKGSPEDCADAAQTAVEEAERKERVELQKATWTLGDGSPQALLQEVVTRFNASAQDISTAQGYFEQFDADEGLQVDVEQIEEKLKEWQLEVDLEALKEAAQDDKVPKHRWFQFVFEKVLHLDKPGVEEETKGEDGEDETPTEE